MTSSQIEQSLKHINCWIFDLDNTLYPITKSMLSQLDDHMSNFVAKFLNVNVTEARQIQKNYFRKYGLTLRGLMLNHGLDPKEFFNAIGPMDLNEVYPNPDLGSAIKTLPGRKIIYTNSSSHHAQLVLDRLGFPEVFDAIFDITAANYIPKPAVEAYEHLCSLYKINPKKAAMVDDIVKNLEPAASLGMTTIWMQTNTEWAQNSATYKNIHFVTDDIGQWTQKMGRLSS